MIIQSEDVIDTLKVLYGDRFEYVFYVDNSSGHDRLRPDELNANAINKSFGGQQSKMRYSEMKNDSYLALFKHSECLKVRRSINVF